MTGEESNSDDTTAENVYEHLEPFEPYTTAELAGDLSVERGHLRQLLDKLRGEGRVRQKKPPGGGTLWIREPPAHTCQNCGREFEVKFLHPVLSSAQFCPRCGTQL